MEQQKPQIPTLKDSQKPQVKIKGLQAGLSLMDRLKQFKKKDLAFISAGLGVLFMAPLAEHFMMAPGDKEGVFNQGWDFKNAGALGANASPYENGINGLAPGGVTGGGDIITPLNVRDPSSLVMGPGASQQAPATSVAPPPPPKAESNEWKDALAASKAGASEAVKRAALPVPKPSLTNAGLRGLGAVSGGGGGSYSMAPISSQGLTSNRAADSGSLQRVQAAPGFRGVGTRGSKNSSAGSMEALKKASAGAIDQMNRSGPGGSALEAAANMAMNGGAGAGGRGAGGEGREDKGPGGNQDKNAMNVGESLEFMRRKAEQEKAIDLKWKLKEADAMLWPDLKKEMLKELAMAPVKGISASIQEMIKDFGSDKSKSGLYICTGEPVWHVDASKVEKDCSSTTQTKEGGKPFCLRGNDIYESGANGVRRGINCKKSGGEADEAGAAVRQGVNSVPATGAVKPQGGVQLTPSEICDALSGVQNPAIDPKTGKTRKDKDGKDVALTGSEGELVASFGMIDNIKRVNVATLTSRLTILGKQAGDSDKCGSTTITTVTEGRGNVVDRASFASTTFQRDVLPKVQSASGVTVGRAQALAKDEEAETKRIQDALKGVSEQNAQGGNPQTLEEAKARIDAAKAILDKIDTTIQGKAADKGTMPNAEALASAEKSLKETEAPLKKVQEALNDVHTWLTDAGNKLTDPAVVSAVQDLRARSVDPTFGGYRPARRDNSAAGGSVKEYAITTVAQYDQEAGRYKSQKENYDKLRDAADNVQQLRSKIVMQLLLNEQYIIGKRTDHKPQVQGQGLADYKTNAGNVLAGFQGPKANWPAEADPETLQNTLNGVYNNIKQESDKVQTMIKAVAEKASAENANVEKVAKFETTPDAPKPTKTVPEAPAGAVVAPAP